MAELQFMTDIQLNGQQLKNARIENVSSLPTANDEMKGRVVFNTTDARFYYCTGSDWVKIATVNELQALTTGSVVTIEKNGNTYTIKQGGVAIAPTIDIPKDMVVESGSIVGGTWNGNAFTPGTGSGKALALVIANGGGTVYINVADLVDAYTGGSSSTITVSISGTNQITASIVAGSITESLMNAEFVTALRSATITAPTASTTQATAGTKTISALFQTIVNNIKSLFDSMNNKVDKVSGKGLSTNDFTNDEKNKLANLSPVYVYQTSLEGMSGSIEPDVHGLKGETLPIIEVYKNGTMVVITTSWTASRQIEWASNVRFSASDNVKLVAIQRG